MSTFWIIQVVPIPQVDLWEFFLAVYIFAKGHNNGFGFMYHFISSSVILIFQCGYLIFIQNISLLIHFCSMGKYATITKIKLLLWAWEQSLMRDYSKPQVPQLFMGKSLNAFIRDTYLCPLVYSSLFMVNSHYDSVFMYKKIFQLYKNYVLST